jgi:hypothetical protein
MNDNFAYIIEKIKNATFYTDPFKFLYIENFLSAEHLELLNKSTQVKIPKYDSTEELIENLQQLGYEQQKFPGCTTSVEEYLNWYNNKSIENLYNGDIVEGFGMAWRLNNIEDADIKQLITFLNSDAFHFALKEKFQLLGETRISTSIQKYLTGYEISPHPDIRSKSLTYLININTDSEIESIDEMHTHLLKFNDKYSYVYEYWKNNTDIDRCWVPWNWCETKRTINKNNSLVMFAPDNDTLHAVRLNYNHLKYQRTQLYGNLWYKNKERVKGAFWKELVK